MRPAAAVIGLLLVFCAFVSGSIYPWSSHLFNISVLVLACTVLWQAGPGGLPRLLPAWALLAVVYASCLWSVNLAGTLGQAFPLTGHILFAFIVSVSVREEGRRAALLRVLFWSSVLVSLYGAYQYLFGFGHTEEYLKGAEALSTLDPDRLASARATVRYGRVFSTMLSSNVLACYLAMAIPAGLSLAGAAEGRGRKALYWAGLAAVFAAAVLTRSVGGMAAAIAGVLVYLAASDTAAGRRLAGRAMAAGGALVAAGLVIALVRLMRAGPLGLGWSVEQRLNYWEGALDIWRASPLTGFGAGSFGVEYMRYMPAGAGETKYAHDLFLHALAETGPPGALAVAVLFAMMMVWCARKLRLPGWGVHAPVVMAGGAAFFVHNLVDYTWFVPETAVVFWFLFGLAASEGAAAETEPTGTPAGRAASVAVIALLLVFGVYEVRAYLAGQRVTEALGVLAENEITNAAEARTTPPPYEAGELVRDAISLKPYDDSLHALLAGLYEGELSGGGGRPAADIAEYEYRRATALNPGYPYHHRDLGILYLRMGDRARAREEFERALARYPSSGPLRKYLEQLEKEGG